MDEPKGQMTEDEIREYAGAHGYELRQQNSQTPRGNNLNVIDIFDQDGKHKWKWVAIPGHIGLVSPAVPERGKFIPCVVERDKGDA